MNICHGLTDRVDAAKDASFPAAGCAPVLFPDLRNPYVPTCVQVLLSRLKSRRAANAVAEYVELPPSLGLGETASPR